MAMGQRGCHAQQIEKNYSPSKRIKRRSNFVRLLNIIFFIVRYHVVIFPQNHHLFNPCTTNRKKYSPSWHPITIFKQPHKIAPLFFLRVNNFFRFVTHGLKSSNFDGKSPHGTPIMK